MIDTQLLRQTVENEIAGTDAFIVSINVGKDNRIVVELDSSTSLDIDTCAKITRAIEKVFDRDAEDYELEVGSAGLTSPFKVKGQFDKNLGNEVEVLTADGRKFTGTLVETTDSGFTVEVPTKVRREGKKRPEIVNQPETLAYTEAKSVKYVLKFK